MTEAQRVEVWDIGVRFFHWSLVVVFVLAYVSGDDESFLHVVMGYAVLALVAFRLFWGVVGTKHARFSDFIYGPAATRRYAASLVSLRPAYYLGHNPLGGWMVVALLVALVGACWSGIEAHGALGHGPLAGSAAQGMAVTAALAHDDDRERPGGRDRHAGKDEFWEEIHEALSNFTLFLVVVHVFGVLVASAVHRENLIKAMITGYKTLRER